jgi:glycerol-3-phosphate dehydrogenase
VLSPADAASRFPELHDVPMTAAAVWYDYTTVEADRLTFAWAEAAASHGAVLAHYVEAPALITDGGRYGGASVRDQCSGNQADIRARTVVNATGGALDRLLGDQASTRSPMIGAMNLVMHQPAPSAAIGRQGSLGRNLFMVPWRGRAVFGTWESARFDLARPDVPSAEDVEAFSRELSAAFGGAFNPAAIALVHFGIVPAVRLADGRMVPKGGDHICDHTRQGRPELVSVACTKYTTARGIADKVVTRLMEVLGRSPVLSRTKATPLPVPPPDTAARLARANEEMVVTLEDAVVRRTTIGALGRPDEHALAEAARIVGTQLGWDDSRREREVEAVRRFYDGRAT